MDLFPSELISLLSAPLHPMRGSLNQRSPENTEESPPYGGYVVETANQPSAGQPGPTTQKPPNSQDSDQSHAQLSHKKHGRPRKNHGGSTGELPEERRRAQFRLAERAYRSRKEEALSRYEAQIAELETAMQTMNTTIHLFGERLEQAGVLSSNTDLKNQLHNTMNACKSLINSNSTADEDTLSSSMREESPPSSLPAEQEQDISSSNTLSSSHAQLPLPLLSPSPRPIITLKNAPTPLGHGSPLLFDTTTITNATPPSIATYAGMYQYNAIGTVHVKPPNGIVIVIGTLVSS